MRGPIRTRNGLAGAVGFGHCDSADKGLSSQAERSRLQASIPFRLKVLTPVARWRRELPGLIGSIEIRKGGRFAVDEIGVSYNSIVLRSRNRNGRLCGKGWAG